MPTSKATRDLRVSQGLCELCGEEPLDGNTRKGLKCKKRNKEYTSKAKKKRIALGICIRFGCYNKAKEGCNMCQECITASSKRTSAISKKKREDGFCPYCAYGTPVEPGKAACKMHLDGVNDYGKKLYKYCIENNLCYLCPLPKNVALPGEPYCDKCRLKVNSNSRENWAFRRQRVLEYYGHECVCCGVAYAWALEIDHINGGGNKHRREIGIGNLYKWLVKNNFPPGYQILCCICNKGKLNKTMCPHNNWPKEALEELHNFNKSFAIKYSLGGINNTNLKLAA